MILVTGGAGYIGNVVVRKLLDKGYEVRVFDRLIFGDYGLKDIKNRIQLVKGDIRSIDLSILDGIDGIIHLAGFSTDPTSQYDPKLTDSINHIATEKLAKMARSRKIKRFVYASSCSVYFTLDTPLEPPLYKETHPINPITTYSLTKRCSEQVLCDMTDRDFQPTIFRKGTLYGYSNRMRYDLVFNSFTKDAFFKKILTVDAAGEIWRPMIDIQDAGDIYVRCLELPLAKVGGKLFNVSDQNWKIGDLAKKIKIILKKEKGLDIKLDLRPHNLTRNYRVDNAYFTKVFDFRPSRTIKDALLEIWDHLENDKKHNANSIIHYGDRWYKKFFETREGKKFRKYD